MRILCLDVPSKDATLEKYAPYMVDEAHAAWAAYKSGIVRDIYFRQDRPGVVIMMEAESVEEAQKVMAEFPLAKSGLLHFEFIPFGPFVNWELLFAQKAA